MSNKHIAIIVGVALGIFGLLCAVVGVVTYACLRRRRVTKRASVFPHSADVFAVSGESYAHSPTLKEEAVFVYKTDHLPPTSTPPSTTHDSADDSSSSIVFKEKLEV